MTAELRDLLRQKTKVRHGGCGSAGRNAGMPASASLPNPCSGRVRSTWQLRKSRTPRLGVPETTVGKRAHPFRAFGGGGARPLLKGGPTGVGGGGLWPVGGWVSLVWGNLAQRDPSPPPGGGGGAGVWVGGWVGNWVGAG